MAPTKRNAPSHPTKVEATELLEVSPNNQAGEIKVELNVVRHVTYESVRKINVKISRQLEGDKKPTTIGHVFAFWVDRYPSFVGETRGAWISELLENGPRGDKDKTSELREMVNMIFNKNGSVSEKFQHVAGSFDAEMLVFIDTLKIDDKYRISGNGVQPFRMALELLPQVLGDDRGQVPCVLRAWYSNSAIVPGKKYNAKEALNIEAKLKRSYSRNGFEVVYNRDKKVKGDITVMGRLIDCTPRNEEADEAASTDSESIQEIKREAFEESIEEEYVEEETTGGHRISSKKRKRVTKSTSSTKRTKKSR